LALLVKSQRDASESTYLYLLIFFNAMSQVAIQLYEN
jgi:hypothetical protein